MTLALRDLQAAFAAHLLSDDRPDLVAMVVGDAIPAAARLRVHRHNLLASLTAALGLTYSTVRRLAGDDSFRAMARDFISGQPPSQPVLSEYGAGFADFIATRPPADSLPYLADIARLDWTLNVAFNSAYEPRLDKDMLATIPVEELPARTLRLAAGAALLHARYPVDRLWKAAQPDAAREEVDFGARATALLVLRQSDDSAFVSLDEGEAAFLAALMAGRSLEEATEAAFAVQSTFDLSSTFPRLLALGVFAAMQ